MNKEFFSGLFFTFWFSFLCYPNEILSNGNAVNWFKWTLELNLTRIEQRKWKTWRGRNVTENSETFFNRLHIFVQSHLCVLSTNWIPFSKISMRHFIQSVDMLRPRNKKCCCCCCHIRHLVFVWFFTNFVGQFFTKFSNVRGNDNVVTSLIYTKIDFLKCLSIQWYTYFKWIWTHQIIKWQCHLLKAKI